MNQPEPIQKPRGRLRWVWGTVLFVVGFVSRDGNSECACDSAAAKMLRTQIVAQTGFLICSLSAFLQASFESVFVAFFECRVIWSYFDSPSHPEKKG